MKTMTIFTKEDVKSDINVWEIPLEGQYVILKPESLREDFREAKYQLVKCCGGFGCDPDKIGNAIFVQEMYEGDNAETYRRERCNRDFLGVATDKAIEEFKKLYGWRD